MIGTIYSRTFGGPLYSALDDIDYLSLLRQNLTPPIYESHVVHCLHIWNNYLTLDQANLDKDHFNKKGHGWMVK